MENKLVKNDEQLFMDEGHRVGITFLENLKQPLDFYTEMTIAEFLDWNDKARINGPFYLGDAHEQIYIRFCDVFGYNAVDDFTILVPKEENPFIMKKDKFCFFIAPTTYPKEEV